MERPGPKYEMFRTLGDYYRLPRPVKAEGSGQWSVVSGQQLVFKISDLRFQIN